MESDDTRTTFSTLTGIILLLFVLSFFNDRTVLRLPIRVGEFSILVVFKTIDLVSPVLAFIAGTGLYIQTEKKGISGFQNRLTHCFLPFACTLVMGVSLRNSSGGLAWWLLLFFWGGVLFMVFLAETVVCDPNDVRCPFFSILLTGLSYAVFLVAVVAIRVNVTRLSLSLPLLFLISMIVTNRIFSFWLVDWNIEKHSGICALLILESASGLHYLPLNSISYGLLIFIWYYIVVNLEIWLSQGNSIRDGIIKQIPFFIVLSAAFLLTFFFL